MICVVDMEDGDNCAWAVGPGIQYVGTAISKWGFGRFLFEEVRVLTDQVRYAVAC